MKKTILVAMVSIALLFTTHESKAQWYKNKTFLLYAAGSLVTPPGTMTVVGWFHLTWPRYSNFVLISPLPATPSGIFQRGQPITFIDESTGKVVTPAQAMELMQFVVN